MGLEHRPPSEIQMGNGTLLVTFDSIGEIEQIFAPHIDALGARLGAYRTSVLIPRDRNHPELHRIGHELFDIRLQLLPGSQVLRAEYHHKHRPLKILRTIGMHPTEPVMLDQWKIRDDRAGLLHESIPWFGNATTSQCSLYHPNLHGLVHHRGRRWLGIMARGETQWARVGHLNPHDRSRLWSGERVYAPLGEHDLGHFPEGPVQIGWDHVVQGPSTFGAIAIGDAQMPSDTLEFFIICADGEKPLARQLELFQHVPSERYFQMIESQVIRRHQPAQPVLERIHNPRVRALCERSIDVLHSLQDAKTGALMAAAEVDPLCHVSGGYGFSWPRDGAYLAGALSAFGYRERVEHYFKFLVDTQDESGAWFQRYTATGQAGPSWGRIQIDEPASAIGLAYLHYRKTYDLFWLERFWPSIKKGLAFIENFHTPEFPMGQPSHDLWEERMGFHAYSLAAESTAFLAGAYLARELSDRQAQIHYHRKARELYKMTMEKFFPNGGEHIRRAFVAGAWDLAHGGGYWDEAVDASLLGLITPFRLIAPKSPLGRRIAERVRQHLWCHGTGGVFRYQNDHYRGGQPWIITTLWLAGVELSLGNYAEARECFQWATSKATVLGMLPEQVHKETGKPFWVIPLAWSHAMYLMFVKQVLEKKAEARIWEDLK